LAGVGVLSGTVPAGPVVPGQAARRLAYWWPASCIAGRILGNRPARWSVGLACGGIIVEILVILIILLLVFGGGGFYAGRGNRGGGLGNILYVLAVIVLVVIVLRLLGIGV
jgi:hypothetical protein